LCLFCYVAGPFFIIDGVYQLSEGGGLVNMVTAINGSFITILATKFGKLFGESRELDKEDKQ